MQTPYEKVKSTASQKRRQAGIIQLHFLSPAGTAPSKTSHCPNPAPIFYAM
jgi:hypothetical protein